MADSKIYKLPADKIVDLAKGVGACLATDKITVAGEPVDFMSRQEPSFETDSGWRFFSGSEGQDYVAKEILIDG